MATDSKRGVPSLLIRPTEPRPAPVDEPVEAEADELVEGQGRGESRASIAKSRRRKPSVPSEKVSKRGLHIRDDLWERLQLQAIARKTTVSAIANDLLDRNLARLRIERDA
jgi:hypothetical protein